MRRVVQIMEERGMINGVQDGLMQVSGAQKEQSIGPLGYPSLFLARSLFFYLIFPFCFIVFSFFLC